MQDYENAVFVSYAWGGDRESIVNEIDETLQLRGIRIVRDKRALGYKGSIKEFMERIGRGSCVIVVISDKYLRSPNCMFELIEIAENKQFHDRVFPIVLSDANIYDPIKRLEYVKYWEDKLSELGDAMKTVSPANLQGIRDDLDQYDNIRDNISSITSVLKDMNTLTPEMHRDSEFTNLYDSIEQRLRQVDPGYDKKISTSPQQKENKQSEVSKATRSVDSSADRKKPISTGLITGVVVLVLAVIGWVIYSRTIPTVSKETPGENTNPIESSNNEETSTAVNGMNVSRVNFSAGAVSSAFVQGQAGEWVEVVINDQYVERFYTETERDDWSVYLTARDGDYKIQLDLYTQKVMEDVGNGMVERNEIVESFDVATGYGASVVRYDGGEFVQAGNGEWNETSFVNNDEFHFVEQGRDEWSVYLFDSSRDINIIIDLWAKTINIKDSNSGQLQYEVTSAENK